MSTSETNKQVDSPPSVEGSLASKNVEAKQTGEKVLSRHYSTIGIDDVFLDAPPHFMLSNYLKNGSHSSFKSWEILGTIKSTPEDFCVREVFQSGRVIPGVANGGLQGMAVADILDPARLPPQNLDVKEEEKANAASQGATSGTEGSASGQGAPHDSAAGTKTPAVVIEDFLVRAIAKGPGETMGKSAKELVASLQNLQEFALERIKTISSTAKSGSQSLAGYPSSTPILLPPLETTSLSLREERGALHRALKAEYPLLKSASDGTEHWVKVVIDESYDKVIQYLQYPAEDISTLLAFQKMGFQDPLPGSKGNRNDRNLIGADKALREANGGSHVVLRLRPDVAKEERRSVHHMIAERCKQFATNTVSDYPLEADSKTVTTALIVHWQKRADPKGNRKRKRGNNDAGGVGSKYPNVLFVMKKRQKEHLTAIQKLTQAMRCRQADIGLAGIKDLQAVTYQFCTIRNTQVQRVKNASRQLQRHGIELGNYYQVDWMLNNGELQGNQFEIVLRDLKRVSVESCGCEPAKEHIVECDAEHFGAMVERVRNHGFVNFFGEQRVGSAGATDDVGVRAFDIGRAMIQQEFTKAIDLLMTGRSNDSREREAARRARNVWKETSGDPVATLKAFHDMDVMPRERAVLKGLRRYGSDKPQEALKCLAHNVRVFWINAYQSYLWNRAASKRIEKYGTKTIQGDLYISEHSKEVKIVGSDAQSVPISQVVLPLPGHMVRYPENDIGELYRTMMEKDNVVFKKDAPIESTAKGGYRRLTATPLNLSHKVLSDQAVKLNFQLPKGSYATMMLRELMLTTASRSNGM